MIIFNHHETVKILAQFLPTNSIIVEAGAFNGSDTKRMAAQWPQATIHAFEPVPEIYDTLLNNTKQLTNVYYYPYALSNKNSVELFYVSENPKNPGVASQAGSLHQPKERLTVSPLIFPRTIMVNTITLPVWMQQHHIDHIDLLWLDTQGHELIILQSSQPILKKIKIILAEVSFIESYHGQATLDDLIAWMQQQGFDHVASDFDDTTNNFFGNVLLIRRF